MKREPIERMESCKRNVNPTGKVRVRRMPTKREQGQMQQVQLSALLLGQRYTALGNFSRSADLKSLFIASADESANRVMWDRLNALACAPMQAIGADSLKALEGSRPAARVHSRYGPRKPASAVNTESVDRRRLWGSQGFSGALKRALRFGGS